MATVGLIAGAGTFPLEIARAADAAGHDIIAVGLRGLADDALAEHAHAHATQSLGEFRAAFEFWKAAGATDVLMAGKVPKTFLWERPDAFQPDALAREMLAGLADRKDDSLLGAVADLIEAEGFRLLEQVSLTPELRAPAGALGRHAPDTGQWADIAFGWPIAKELGALDVGQTVVVQNRAVLALEAIEGTDAAIARGARLAAKDGGARVIKVAKPAQDPRFDMPTIGTDTIETMAREGADLLAVEAGATVVVERDRLVAAADAAGIAVVGVDAETIASEDTR